MELRGKVHEVGAVQQVSDSFKKRDLILYYADNPQYPEYIKLEANQDKVSLFDNLTVGQDIEVSFNLRGRPWTNKEGVTTYFNSLIAWKITNLQASGSNYAPQGAQTNMPPPVDINDGNDDDDLPF